MNAAQLSALATAINADSTLTGYAALNEFDLIALAMNTPVATTLWMPSVSTPVILSAILAADMSALTAPQLSYLQMLLSVGSVDATSANVRTNFSSLFTGKTTLTNLLQVSARAATRFEALAAFLTPALPNNISTAFGVIVSARDVQTSLGK